MSKVKRETIEEAILENDIRLVVYLNNCEGKWNTKEALEMQSIFPSLMEQEDFRGLDLRDRLGKCTSVASFKDNLNIVALNIHTKLYEGYSTCANTLDVGLLKSALSGLESLLHNSNVLIVKSGATILSEDIDALEEVVGPNWVAI